MDARCRRFWWSYEAMEGTRGILYVRPKKSQIRALALEELYVLSKVWHLNERNRNASGWQDLWYLRHSNFRLCQEFFGTTTVLVLGVPSAIKWCRQKVILPPRSTTNKLEVGCISTKPRLTWVHTATFGAKVLTFGRVWMNKQSLSKTRCRETSQVKGTYIMNIPRPLDISRFLV